MIGRVLMVLIACAVLVFGVMWIVGGGLSRAIDYAKTISNPLELFTGPATGAPFSLPGQPDLVSGPALDFGDTSLYAGSPDESGLGTDPQEFGSPSPESAAVHLSLGDGSADAHAQHLIIEADAANTAPVSLSGWSLQSALTGTRAALPPAAPRFTQGVINAVEPVALDPGSSAIVATNFSPVGVSFRENRCTGYLGAFQSFVPALETSCPSPAQDVAARVKDDTCAFFAQTLAPCTIPRSVPQDLSASCRHALSAALTYNSCVGLHRSEDSFFSQTWRLYLDSVFPLWRAHDTVRLLDANGRVVDVLTY